MKQVIILFFAWFSLINIFSLIANNRVILFQDNAYPWIESTGIVQSQGNDITQVSYHWDSVWYLDIAKNGYSFIDGQLSNIVFFPLYPLFMRIIGTILFNSYILSGWIISLFFTLLSSVYLYKLVKEFHKKSDPLLSVAMMLFFPTAVFFNAIYTESTFLFFSIASFYYLFKKEYFKTGLLGMLASLARPLGFLLFIPLFYEYLTSKRKKIFSTKTLAFFLVPLGTFLFFLYHYLTFGDFFLFLKAEDAWGHGFTLGKLYLETRPAIINASLDVFFTIFGLITALIISKKVRLSYGLYMLSNYLIILSSGTLNSINRYTLILFPIFILGASIKNKLYQYIWLFSSVLFWGLYTLLFVNNYWAG